MNTRAVSGRLKTQAFAMRERGDSYPMISAELGVNKSTLSTWLSGLRLSDEAREKILQRKREHVFEIQKLGAATNHREKFERIQSIQLAVAEEFETHDFGRLTQELVLTSLYIGEGEKNVSSVGLGNSNPEVALMFVNLMRSVYQIDESKFRVYLGLRADQDSAKESEYWSKILDIPLEKFRKPQFDKRTLGKKTWDGYHGVCAVKYFDANIAKRLACLQELLFAKINP